jgi:hypothetical protein
MVDSSILDRLRIVSQQYNQKKAQFRRDSLPNGLSQDLSSQFIAPSQPSMSQQTLSTQVSGKLVNVTHHYKAPPAIPKLTRTASTMTDARAHCCTTTDTVILYGSPDPLCNLDPVLAAIEDLRDDIAEWRNPREVIEVEASPDQPRTTTFEDEESFLSFLFDDETHGTEGLVDNVYAIEYREFPDRVQLVHNTDQQGSSAYRPRPVRRRAPRNNCIPNPQRKSARLIEATQSDVFFDEAPLLKRMRVVYTAVGGSIN